MVRANRVVAVSPSARVEGIRPGWRRRESQRACPSLVILDHDPDRDMRAFEPVVRALADITALLEVSGPGRCTFLTRGPSRYFGGDEALAVRTLAAVRAAAPADAVDITGSPAIGVADAAFAATQAALSARASGTSTLVVPPGQSATFLADLPVDVVATELGSDDLAGLFVRLGLRTLGHLAALPATDIAARFGVLGADAHRLARGLDRRPPQARRPPPDLAVEHRFDTPVVTSGPVAFVGKSLGDELLEALRTNGLACAQILIVAETDHGERSERLWRHEPAFTAASIAERVRWQLDGWADRRTAGVTGAPTAGITLLRVMPTEVIAATGEQRGFWGGRSEADDRARRGIARLVGLLGPEAVQVPVRQGGRQVGDVVVTVPSLSADLDDRTTVERRGASAPPWPGQLPEPSPPTVWREPPLARLIDADGRDVQVTGRGFVSAPPVRLMIGSEAVGAPTNDAAKRVTGWSAPWPTEERWWDPERARRCARLQVTTAGGAAYLLVVERGEWRVAAAYD